MDAQVRPLASLVLIVFLSACGGSGSDDPAPVVPPVVEPPVVEPPIEPPLEPTIEFTDDGPLILFSGEGFANPVVDNGCDVRYHSDDSNIATVSASSGEIYAVAPGTTEIRTSNTQSCEDKAVSLEVKQGEFPFTAWIGQDGSEVMIDSAAVGYDLFRSRQSDCDISAYAACDHGQFDPVTGGVIADTAATIDTKAYYVLNDTEHSSREAVVGDTHPPSVIYHAIAAFQGRYWLVGGIESGAGLGRDNTKIYSSADGEHWRVESDAPGFAPRWRHQMLAFKGRLWLLGGVVDTGASDFGPSNEIWSSGDGLEWRKEAPETIFPALDRFDALVHGDRVWFISDDEVWSSGDGVNWVQETADAPFGAVQRHAAVSWKNRIWVVEGNTVRSSADGSNWAIEVTEAPFARRGGFSMVVRRDRLWVLPGAGAADTWSSAADAWSSANGRDWRLESTDPYLVFSHEYVALVHGNTFILVGGARSGIHAAPLVSVDGVEWRSYPEGALEPNEWARSVSFKGRLWLVAEDLLSEQGQMRVWSSSDGLDWRLEASASIPHRREMSLTVFQDQLWLIGGVVGNVHLNDIWQSSDGVDWVQVQTQDVQFEPRQRHSVTAWNERLWLIGGLSHEQTFADVWSSADGIEWRRDVEDMGHEAYLHETVVRDDTLYMLGLRGGGKPVYRSANGIDWELLGQSVLPDAQSHAVQYFNNHFWAVAGCEGISPETLGVWSSDDALTWTRELDFPGSERCLRAAHTVYNAEWFIMGGFQGLYSVRGFATDGVWKTNNGLNWQRAYHSSIKMR